MKKIAAALLVITSLSAMAQDSSKVKYYASAGLSVTNSSNFKEASYASIEGGIVKNNMQLGLSLGRGSLAGIMTSGDVASNYYYEVRLSPGFPMGLMSGNLIFGYGGFFDSHTMFVEYGVGVSYSIKKVAISASFSNWNNVNYIAPGIAYSFG